MWRRARAINDWILKRSQSLSVWASIVAIVSLPLALVGGLFAYVQLRDALVPPDPELVFVHPASVAYKIKNGSGKIAEQVLINFGMLDLDAPLGQGPVQVPSIQYDYVNKRSEKGPFAWFGRFATPGHRYFGIVYLSCKGGERLRTYWVYAKHGDPASAFYAERNERDTFEFDVGRLAIGQGYLDELVPRDRRMAIGDR